jgi:hypothetical protein
MAITGSYRTWCFDQAVNEFGTACENAMDEARNSFGKKSKASEAQRQAKAENALRKMLGLGMKFRDIMNPAGSPVVDRPERPKGFDDG